MSRVLNTKSKRWGNDMCTRVSQPAVVIAVTALILAGCSRQAAQKPAPNADLLAIGPNRAVLSIPADYVSAAIDAAGGLATWTQCKKLPFSGVVTVYQEDGSFYLTEHRFQVYPWSDAIRISAREPRATFVWQVVGGQYRLVEGDPGLDVSRLGASYQDYAEAVLRIITAPVRLLDEGVAPTRRPAPVQITGQRYDLIDAKFPPQEIASKEKGREQVIVVEPYWTRGVYFQNRDKSLIDMIWLGNPAKQRFLMVRGYDYARRERDGVLAPTKIEIFQAGPDAMLGQRLVQIDVK